MHDIEKFSNESIRIDILFDFSFFGEKPAKKATLIKRRKIWQITIIQIRRNRLHPNQ